MDYLDFELEIVSGSGREYAVTVVHSPAGEARATMRLPFGELEIKAYLKDLKIALLRPTEQRRRAAVQEEERAVQQFGQALFDALLSGEARSCYDVSRREAARQGKGLRLKLRIQPPELAALPWEFLYDSRKGEYICLSRGTPIVRYLELSQETQPLAVAPPLRILGMIASPHGLPPLNVARVKLRMEEAVSHLSTRGLVELVWLEGQTWRAMQRAMQLGPWHVFHFLGHGGFGHDAGEGLIALANEDGEVHRLPAAGLGRLLADHFPLRLVLLNACEGGRGSERDVFSSSAATLVRRGIPAVLAMQHEISDEAAVEFARAFYEALANDLPVDAAITEARKAMSLASANSIEWGVPVLYTHAPDGVLFNIQRSAIETTLPQEPARSAHTVQDSPPPGASPNQLRRLNTILLVIARPVLVIVIGILLILSGVIRREASSGTPTAGGGSGVSATIVASSTANNTSESTTYGSASLYRRIFENVRVNVVADDSGLPVITIGNNEFFAGPDQNYKIVVTKVS